MYFSGNSILKGIYDPKKRLKTLLYETKLTMLHIHNEKLCRCIKENEETIYVLCGQVSKTHCWWEGWGRQGQVQNRQHRILLLIPPKVGPQHKEALGKDRREQENRLHRVKGGRKTCVISTSEPRGCYNPKLRRTGSAYLSARFSPSVTASFLAFSKDKALDLRPSLTP